MQTTDSIRASYYTNAKREPVQNGFYIYTSKEIMDKCKLRDAYYECGGKIGTRKIKYRNLKIHMALIINYLTHKTKIAGITNISCRKFLIASNSYYYKFCLNILKKRGILFIYGSKNTESYLVGEFCKGYKFNYNPFRIVSDTVMKIQVEDKRLVNKILRNFTILQIPLQFNDKFTKGNYQYCRSKRNKIIKYPKNIYDVEHNMKIHANYVSRGVFYIKSIDPINKIKRAKNYLGYLIKKSFGFILSKKFIKDSTQQTLSKLTKMIEYAFPRVGRSECLRILEEEINKPYGYLAIIPEY